MEAMSVALRVGIILVLLLLMAFPVLPLRVKAKGISTFTRLRYDKPHNKKNIWFVFFTILEFILMALLAGVLSDLAGFIASIPFLSNLFAAIPGIAKFDILVAVKVVLFNLLILYALVIGKLLLKKAILDPAYGLTPRALRAAEEAKKAAGDDQPAGTGEDAASADPKDAPEEDAGEEEDAPDGKKAKKKKKKKRVPLFAHRKAGPRDLNAFAELHPKRYALRSRILALFFEKGGEDDEEPFLYARTWVVRVTSILQAFIFATEALYFVLFLALLLCVFFPLPAGIYDVLTALTDRVYLYPFVSLVFLQELCNVFRTGPRRPKTQAEEEQQKKTRTEEEENARLRKLQEELFLRFDKEHHLRFFPEQPPEEVPDYQVQEGNLIYRSALTYIQNRMRRLSGTISQNYMAGLDFAYMGAHVYFQASFYSELGEYLIAYTYTRLLAGERLIFVVNDASRIDDFSEYLALRLRRLTGSSKKVSWRIQSYREHGRLDQADILLATPDAFRDDSLVDNYPQFFQEVCNAVFLDADEMVNMSSYLCTIMAVRLLHATEGRCGFLFLTDGILQGFQKTLKKYFCLGTDILLCSSAGETESVSYTLWNRESRRTYDNHGQSLRSPEVLIALQAQQYQFDGIRLRTDTPMALTDVRDLEAHGVEINTFREPVPEIHYMICTDAHCNLSATLYTYARFHGSRHSILHILSQPYLLREYFADTVAREDYIHCSSFFLPRTAERIDSRRLGTLRLFCEAATEDGMTLEQFNLRAAALVHESREGNFLPLSPFCQALETREGELKTADYAAYVIAALCETESTPANGLNDGARAKNFYRISCFGRRDKYSLSQDERIFFTGEGQVFEKLLTCNTRVALWLNGTLLGYLPTFPDRVHQQYLPGLTLIYDNTEYEIERIAEDCRTIYLRQENVTFKNCTDTFFLRRYAVGPLTPVGQDGVLVDSRGAVRELRVGKRRARIVGETYGFFNLMSDRQTLDFFGEGGVVGNPALPPEQVAAATRTLENGALLEVSLTATTEVTDRVRRLLCALSGELIRTIFPTEYRCVAVCPLLLDPPAPGPLDPDDGEGCVQWLYPSLCGEGDDLPKEDDPKRVRLYFINDSAQDVGVLDLLYDGGARILWEFFRNVHSYLAWLAEHPERKHYIYFGKGSMPESYDLEGCLALLASFSQEFGSTEERKEKKKAEKERCAFCHHVLEEGRYSSFDATRYICTDCIHAVDSAEELAQIYADVKQYLQGAYPGETFPEITPRLGPLKKLAKGQVLSQYYYDADTESRTVTVESENPTVNVAVSLLRGILEVWQAQNDLRISHAPAQLYFEELLYLRSLDQAASADYIESILPDALKTLLEEIRQAVPGENGFTSFGFLRKKAAEAAADETEDDTGGEDDGESSDDLYDPDRIPRFWKRYLRGQKADDGKEEVPQDAPEEGEDYPDGDGREEEDADEEMEGTDTDITPNCPCINAPPPEQDVTGTTAREEDAPESPAADPAEEAPEESAGEAPPEEDPRARKKREKEEAARKKAEETARKKAEAEEEKARKKAEAEAEKARKKAEKEAEKARKKAAQDPEPTPEPTPEPAPEPTPEPTPEPEPKKGKSKGKKPAPGEGEEQPPKDKKSPKEEKGKEAPKPPKKRKGGFLGGLFSKSHPRTGADLIPPEEDEGSNPLIRVYNELARHVADYSAEPFSREGVTDAELSRIWRYVSDDYPEMFWFYGISYNASTVSARFRCTDSSGKVDVKQVERKRQELRRAAGEFTKGITRRTDPYKAMLTIYRRLILRTDYDTVGLSAGAGGNVREDDVLRSLYGALVNHKMVCAGYAVAMQYLLQSVGIPCGCVISEDVRDGTSCHAFNVVKLGRECAYLDATWGDCSNTGKDGANNLVLYNYLGVPLRELQLCADEDSRLCHTPRKEYYPALEEFRSTALEYFRRNGAYFDRCNDARLVDLFTRTVLTYDPKEMGDLAFSFRCSDAYVLQNMVEYLRSGAYFRLLQKAMENRKVKKKLAAYDCTRVSSITNDAAHTAYFILPPQGKEEVTFPALTEAKVMGE